MGETSVDKSVPATPSERRLDSWKEIALYVHRDVTTVQRWEKQEARLRLCPQFRARCLAAKP
jgi:hypothetical protein